MEVVVRKGDSLWHYSQMFHINLQLIIDSNRNVDHNNLSEGQRVRLPGFAAQDYQIRPGDTLWSIGQRRSLPLEAITLVNPNLDEKNLNVGQTIKVPTRITWRLVDSGQSYDYIKLMNDIKRLLEVYPFMQIPVIGKTVLGKKIPEIVIGTGEKRVHYNGSFHANEWITTSIIMTFLNDYLLALTNHNLIRGLPMFPLYQQSILSIVPMVNPDGVDLVLHGPPEIENWNKRVVDFNKGSTDFTDWKANIRGVDLNDQFPARWELEKARNQTEPGPRDFVGEKPLSEPEAMAMAKLIKKRDFVRVLAFHTQGEVIYWGFENLEPPESEDIVKEFSRVSGYEPIKTIESYAGCKDWFIQDWKRPGFTIELGRGINPLPLSQFDEIYQKSLGIFLAGLYM
ncbi:MULTISPECIES: M14 family metallopeptidase [unclassified Bacillus (in: firmicutes)]|uniref:M14 family metallopeptidase n=1 Tax=unclassified Bacillus (in: firmicutes) TaxID=185979 RepID=UPI001BE5B9E3|nr:MULTISPECIES: M14 family metallopeptidase [unclassified Bacillus (in: firmicutes)]MBT2725089.1 LysM peptidoglycan-binding domain-containing protein [Bacillus sp. ISL-46]MBT2743468.1 LysM peptidoglycan-binding domain-containing protein [Bacillus sp. ISL-77]